MVLLPQRLQHYIQQRHALNVVLQAGAADIAVPCTMRTSGAADVQAFAQEAANGHPHNRILLQAVQLSTEAPAISDRVRDQAGLLPLLMHLQKGCHC